MLAPCIWPLLPIVLSASSGGGKQRPLGISFGVMTSFSAATLALSWLERSLPVAPNLLRLAAVIVVAGLGEDGAAYVIADCSVGGVSPAAWARSREIW